MSFPGSSEPDQSVKRIKDAFIMKSEESAMFKYLGLDIKPKKKKKRIELLFAWIKIYIALLPLF